VPRAASGVALLPSTPLPSPRGAMFRRRNWSDAAPFRRVRNFSPPRASSARMTRRKNLESTSGAAMHLDEHRGRAVVLFCETRRHTADNEALKRACGRLAVSGIHGDRLRVLGVADVRGLRPFRAIVRAAVREAAKRFGVELWMDWDGALEPLALSGRSDVFVIAPDGDTLFHRSGPLDHAATDHFYAALGEALARAHSSAA
jgi:hypothetical protein